MRRAMKNLPVKICYTIIMQQQYNDLITIQEASEWASRLLNRAVAPTNISYLIQYGKIKKYGDIGKTKVKLDDIKRYYESFNGNREIQWKERLGNDLNWNLSFDHLREKDTTKHVHRLHPYKGKFIPQLVEYFIDEHTDKHKAQAYFKRGDIILDPFVGSGTTLVQTNEQGIYSIGIDISRFNCLISEVKLLNYDFELLEKKLKEIIKSVSSYETDSNMEKFENELTLLLNNFNNEYFPGYEFKYKLNAGTINDKFIKEKEQEFLARYQELVKKYNIPLKQNKNESFLDKWYIKNVRDEIEYAFSLVKKIENVKNKKILAVTLSRTIRSCRATTHSDLATLKEPQITTYYCYKHKKICKPIFSIKKMFLRYGVDTLIRLKEFHKLKTNVYSIAITADSRTVDIFSEVKKRHLKFYELLSKQKIKGIFSSPPYVGQIDYHEQHAYAYSLMGFERKDELEIGPLSRGRGIEAQKSYIKGISEVLNNSRKFLVDDFDIFIVANDKHNLYPEIAKMSNMKIVDQFKRPVLNRTERDKSPYSETIFHFKGLG